MLYFRDFIEQHYVNIKQANPKFPILIRECSGVQPVVWARYGQCVVNSNYNITFLLLKAMAFRSCQLFAMSITEWFAIFA